MTTLGRAASLGDTLRHIRESKGMTTRVAAIATGISNAYISQVETGRIVTPSPAFLRRLAHGYGVSYDELMRVAGYTDATSDATPIAPPPILGRVASLRVAYQAALHDLAQVTAERDTARNALAIIADTIYVPAPRNPAAIVAKVRQVEGDRARYHKAIVDSILGRPFGASTDIQTVADIQQAAQDALACTDALRKENAALRSEILTLRARLGNIADLTTMPLPEDWMKKEGERA